MERRNILLDSVAAGQFIEACHGLKADPLGSINYYDYFAYWQEQAMNTMTPVNTMTPANQMSNPTGRNAAHGGPSFGPWHRLMILVFEAQCRRIFGNDDFRLPYWDWGEDADDPNQSSIWSVDLLGGFGDPV